MSYSNQTTHYGIPLPTQSDLVNLLDWNTSSEAIDTAIYGAEQAAGTASTEIVGIKATIARLENADVQFQSDLSAIDGRVTSLEQRSGGLEGDIADVADMITAREVPSAQSDQRILVDEWFRYNGVLYVCTVQINVGDTIVPNVNCRATNIESEMASGGAVTASDVALAPIAGMQATNVQDGISELKSAIPKIEGIAQTTSGTTRTITLNGSYSAMDGCSLSLSSSASLFIRDITFTAPSTLSFKMIDTNGAAFATSIDVVGLFIGQ